MEVDIFDIATFGTSLTAGTASDSGGGWQRPLAEALTPSRESRLRIYNLGVGGASSANGLAAVAGLIQYRPKMVLIEFMMNDCENSRAISTAQSQTNHEAIISAIQSALPATSIYLMTMNSPIGSATTDRPNIASYNAVYSTIATNTVGVELIDIAPSWSDATSGDIPDGIHPIMAATKARTIPAIVSAIGSLVD